MLTTYAVAVSIIYSMIVFFFKDKPDAPPSVSAAVERLNFKDSVKHILKNKNIVLALLTYGIFMGTNISMQIVTQQYTALYGISDKTASLIVGIGTSLTLIPSLIVSYLSTKSYKYNRYIIALGCIGFSTLMLTALTPGEKDMGNLGVGIIAFVILGLAVQPLIFEFLAEVSFPVQEELVGSLFILVFFAVSDL